MQEAAYGATLLLLLMLDAAREGKEVAHDTKQVYFFMAIEKKEYGVPKKINGILGWSIIATILGFGPCCSVAIYLIAVKYYKYHWSWFYDCPLLVSVLIILLLGVYAIINAEKCKNSWNNGDIEKAKSTYKRADYMSLTTVMFGLLSGVFYSQIWYITIRDIPSSLIVVLSLIFLWFGIAGMNEGKDRICGVSGGFIIGLLPVCGLYIISKLPIEDYNTTVSGNKNASNILGWAIASTVLGFWPIGIIAIAKAVKSQKLWKNEEHEKADVVERTADILSVVTVAFALVLGALSSFLIKASSGSISIILGLLLGLSGLVGMLEGKHRTCGLAGGFILGMFPIVGWIMVSTFSWKGEMPDAWLKGKSKFV